VNTENWCILGSNGQGHDAQKPVSVFRQRNIAAGCVRKQPWVFPAAVPRRTSHANNTEFSLQSRVTTDHQFLRAWFFSQPAAKTLPVWVTTLS